MASTVLARSIGYPGSSIAFAQLLSAMERSGLIERDVRGKRTYRVRVTEQGRERAGGTLRRQSPGHGTRHTRPEGRGNGALDYDELAQRLLSQVARRLAGDQGLVATTQGATHAGGSGAVDGLEQRVRMLELELAKARAARLALQEENDELRSQLERIRANLEGETRRRAARPRSTPSVAQVDQRDVALLHEMLSAREGGNPRRDKATSA